MAKQNKIPAVDEQGYLIDVHPKNQKAILEKAKTYKQVVSARQRATEKEVQLKGELLELIKAAKLKPMEDGKIKLSLGDFKITVTPRDMLVQVKDKSEDA